MNVEKKSFSCEPGSAPEARQGFFHPTQLERNTLVTRVIINIDRKDTKMRDYRPILKKEEIDLLISLLELEIKDEKWKGYATTDAVLQDTLDQLYQERMKL